jgi:hypothetical protein
MHENEMTALREHLARLLSWRDAHATFDDAVKDLKPEFRGARPEGLPYSAWQLVEHLRLAQRDILEFCRDPVYREKNWPADYWPEDAAPPTRAAWDESIAGFRADRDALAALARDPSVNLFAPVPNGDSQTYLREILLAADHAAYHVGELIVVRRMLGAWKAD